MPLKPVPKPKPLPQVPSIAKVKNKNKVREQSLATRKLNSKGKIKK